jgi:hypothetical protein
LDLVGSTRTSLALRTPDAPVGSGRSNTHELQEPPRESRTWDAVAWVIVGLVLAIVCATFRQYGVAWDEQGETVYGSMLIDYYRSGFEDHSAFNFVNFRYYGGGFELPAALLARALPLSEYETRHLLGALVGIVGLIATYRLGRRLFGARAGVLGIFFLVLNPTWYGNIFNNARDVPFATGITLCLLLTVHMLDELPRISIRSAVLFGLVFGWTTSVRVGGVLALLFLIAPLALWFLTSVRVNGFHKQVLIGDLLHVTKRLALMCAVAYGVIAALWPWAIQSPLNPLEALTMFSRFPFESNVLFDGQLVPAKALPASYLPVLLLIKTPELLVIAVAVSALLGAHALWKSPPAAAAVRVWAVVIAALFPIVYFVVARPVAYNGMRHFLFVLPSMSVLGAYGADRLFTLLRINLLRVSYGVVLAAGALMQLQIFTELFPHEYVYYNSWAGGLKGADKRYELDYWGMSLQEATERFVHTVESTGIQPLANDPPYYVYVCGNVWSASLYFPSWLKPVPRIEEADYVIAIQDFFCKSPPGSRRVLDVTRDDTVLSYVDSIRPGDRSRSRNRLAIHSRPTVKQNAGVPAPRPVPSQRPGRSKFAPH